MALKPINRIFLWSAPRVMSTAVQRSVAQLPRTLTVHEPLIEPYYFGDKMKNDVIVSQIDPDSYDWGEKRTFEETMYDLIKDYTEYDTIWVKEHAIRAIEFYDIFPSTILRLYRHTFLVRDPVKSMKSFYRTAKEQHVASGIYMRPEEWPSGGFKELSLMFDKIRDLGQEPIVMDAKDIMEYPKEMFMEYCKLVGMKYDDCMINWSDDIDGDWNRSSWHEKLIKSKTFWNKDQYYPQDQRYDHDEFINRQIEEAMPYYDKLCKYKIQPKCM